MCEIFVSFCKYSENFRKKLYKSGLLFAFSWPPRQGGGGRKAKTRKKSTPRALFSGSSHFPLVKQDKLW